MKPQVILAVLIAGLFSCRGGSEFTPADQSRIEAAGNPVIRQLEDFKRKKGVYPQSLEEAKIQNQATKLGSFNYQRTVEESKDCFLLTVGDFSDNGIQMGWNSCSEPGWYVEE